MVAATMAGDHGGYLFHFPAINNPTRNPLHCRNKQYTHKDPKQIHHHPPRASWWWQEHERINTKMVANIGGGFAFNNWEYRRQPFSLLGRRWLTRKGGNNTPNLLEVNPTTPYGGIRRLESNRNAESLGATATEEGGVALAPDGD